MIYMLTVCFHDVFPGCLISLPCGALGLRIIAVRTGNQSSLDTYWILLVPESIERANVFCGSGRETSEKCGVLVWIAEELVVTFLNKVFFSYCSFHQIMLGMDEQVSEGVLKPQGGVSAQNHRAIC